MLGPVSRTGRQRWQGTALAMVAVALAGTWAPAASAVTPPPPPGIKIISASGGNRGQVLVTFRYMSCSVNRLGFHGTSRAGAWKLFVNVYRFTGYHRYSIFYGDDANKPGLSVDGPGWRGFSNGFRPSPLPLPGVGGGIGFPRYNVAAVGFPALFNTASVSTTQRISVAGSARTPCYARPRTR
jgi:hypothetical protein